ncbi:hypothetical protein LJC11_03600, partial [Bacteroidales bacterium OttesenSCG-928-I21]|nr:hypothetical protein [Bacteroidales bacterium OttesenSCG-928-I21]
MKKTKRNLFLKQAKAFMLMLGVLFLINGNASAQMVTVFSETFDTYGFTGDYVASKPANTGLEFLNSIDFKYATSNKMGDGYTGAIDSCIITKNSCKVGHGSDCAWSHPDKSGDGYYLFAVKTAGGELKKIYTKTISVTMGETVVFSLYYRDVDGGYNFEIQATGEAVDNKTLISENFARSGGDWNFHSFTVTATQTGNLTFNVMDKWGYGGNDDNPHKFGIDDITIKKNAILVTSPASLNTYTTTGNTVTLTADYRNAETTAYNYVWQKYNGSSWVAAAETGASGSVSGTTTLNFTPTTESEEGFAFYRLVVGDTYYSEMITVEYTSTEYIFKEDFGGNFPSVDNASGTPSGDWWVMPGNQPAITTDLFYESVADDNECVRTKYGQGRLYSPGGGKYIITKLAGGDCGGKEWDYGVSPERFSSFPTMDDH